MKPANLVVIMSDEHNPKIMGCAGHDIVNTPNIDPLAAEKYRRTIALAKVQQQQDRRRSSA